MKTKWLLDEKRNELATEGKALSARVGAMTATAEELARAEAIVAELAQVDQQLATVNALRELERTLPVETMPAQVRSEPDKFQTLGEQLIAVRNAAFGNVDSRLLPLRAAILGGNESVPSEGGFLVQTAVDAGLEKKVWDESVFVQYASKTVLPAGANSMDFNGIQEDSRASGSRYGGVTGYRVAEGATITASGAQKFYRYTIKPKKYAALGYLTDEVIADASVLEQELSNALSSELAFMLNDDMLNGAGVAGALGVLNAPCVIQVAKEVGQAAATVVYENLLNMWNRRWARGRYAWFINQEVEPQLDLLFHAVGAGGLPAGFIDRDAQGVVRIKGAPVVVTEYNAALGTVGDILLADWSQYKVGTIGGVNKATSMHVQFLTDQMAYRLTMRADGQPKWKAALTPYKATAGRTVAPFVVIAVRV